MGRTSSATRRVTRFDQLTPEREKTFRGETAELILTGQLRSWKGRSELLPFYEAALKGFESDVSDFVDALPFTDAYVLMCNSGDSKVSQRFFEGIRSRLKCGVLAFAKARGLHRVPLNQWPVDLGEKVVRWLKNMPATQPVSAST